MAFDNLPLPVVNFLNLIGVPWPYIDEDMVTQFATLTRQFAQAVQTTHDDATQAINGIAQAHQDNSTQTMRSRWQSMSDGHVSALITGCNVLADALDVAAGYIIAQKVEAIAVLAGMAVAFAADQVAAVATAGLAEIALPLIILAAQRVVKSLVLTIQQYIIAKVIEAAAQPLFAKVEAAMAGLDWSRAVGTASGAGTGFSVDPQAVKIHTTALHGIAATMRTAGDTYQQGVQGLNF